MKLQFSGVLADTRALWHGNAVLVARVATVFYFLPAFASGLFLPVPERGTLTDDAFFGVMLDWYSLHAPWLALIMLVQSFGSAVLLGLLIAPAGLRLDSALLRALRLMPGLVLVWLGAGLLTMAGGLALLIPGFYLIGRTFVVGAAYVDRPERGPLAALTDGIQFTRGNGWLLLSITMMILLVSTVVTSFVDAFVAVLASAAVPATVRLAIDSAGVAAVATAGTLFQTVIQASVYRVLKPSESGAPRRG